MTLSKLAQLANVSVSVVSKAFSGKGEISDAMREHVFSVARAHGCFQQFYHVPYDKPVIAVIVPEVRSRYYVRYIELLGRALEQKGYTMLLSISNFDRNLATELVRYYTVHGKVDGLLLLSGLADLPDVGDCAIVSMVAHQELPFVQTDLATGLREALCHLRACGHRRIGYIGEELTRGKQELFLQLCAELSLEARPEWTVCSHHRFEEAGADGVQRILGQKDRPDAIFCAYSYITRGALAELRANGLRVPHDLSILSMDSDSAPLDDTLDVAHIPSQIERCCETALALLGDQLRKKSARKPSHIAIPTEFYAGNSIRTIDEA